MFLLGLGIGILVGALGCGIVAHRWPNIFNSAVTIVNKIDDKANQQIKGG